MVVLYRDTLFQDHNFRNHIFERVNPNILALQKANTLTQTCLPQTAEDFAKESRTLSIRVDNAEDDPFHSRSQPFSTIDPKVGGL